MYDSVEHRVPHGERDMGRRNAPRHRCRCYVMRQCEKCIHVMSNERCHLLAVNTHNNTEIFVPTAESAGCMAATSFALFLVSWWKQLGGLLDD